MVKREVKQEVVYNSNEKRTKVNFKKFKKVTKMVKSMSSDGSHSNRSAKKDELFKSFKDEPFDLNSQFDMFMSSMR